MTSDASAFLDMRQMIPTPGAQSDIIYVLSRLPDDVVATDVTMEQFSDSSFGHRFLAQTGQATHFMRNKGQSVANAYGMGIEKVFGPCERAIAAFRQANVGDQNTRGVGTLSDIAISLGDSIHALQDSFSPAHTRRRVENDRWLIVDIYVWSEQNKKDHEAGDEQWRNSDVGRACIAATILLLRYFIFSVINKTTEASRQRELLMKGYMQFDSKPQPK